MLDPQKTLERETLLKRIREINAELAQIERNIREIEARLPIEEQLRLKLRRLRTRCLSYRVRLEWKYVSNNMSVLRLNLTFMVRSSLS
jgi:hypothetical protein